MLIMARGLLFNIPSSLNIVNSHIEGGAQALIVRGGTATITASELVSNGKVEADDYAQYNNGLWETGNAVQYATLVVGNATTSYNYTTDCTVDDSTKITMSTTGYLRVYVASANDKNVVLNIAETIAEEIINGPHYFGGDHIYINSDPDNGGLPIGDNP